MIVSFWKTQMDCVFFVYGFMFLLLAVMLWGRRRSAPDRLPWDYLMWFGLLHGINEWCDLLAIDLGDSIFFKWIRLALMAISFIPLVEFGRCGLKAQNVRVPGRWIYLVLFAVTFAGYFAGMSGLNAACRYTFGLFGAIATGSVCLRESFRVKAGERLSLRLIGWAFLIYGPAAGLVVPQAGFFPAAVINHDAFLSFAGFPIQLVRALCATLAALGVWLNYRHKAVERVERNLFRSFMIPGILICSILIGCMAVNWRGELADKDLRQQLMFQAVVLARTINPDRISALSFSLKDRQNPEFLRLSRQLTAYGQAMGLRSIYSMAVRDGHIVFGPENIPEDSPLASPPGTVYQQPRQEEWDAFKSGQPYTIGPIKDEYGVFVSAAAPVIDPHTGKVIILIGLDIDAATFQEVVQHGRLFAFLFFFLLVTTILGFVVALRWRDQMTEVSQKRNLLYLEAAFVFFIGLISTAIGMFLVQGEQSRSQRSVFYELAKEQTGDIVQSFQTLRDHELGGFARFLEGSQSVEPDEFRTFVAPQMRLSQAQAWSLIAAVAREQKDKFETDVRQRGAPDFFIFEKDLAGKHVPVSERPIYYPIQYVSPLEGNEKAVGFDVASEPFRRSALEEAAQTGMATATDLITLVTEERGPRSIAIFHPVFKQEVLSTGAQDAASGRGRLRGFAYVTFRPGDVLARLAGLSAQSSEAGIHDVDLYQLRPDNAPVWVASSDKFDDMIHDGKKGAAFFLKNDRYVCPLFIFGKTYALVVHAKPVFFGGWSIFNIVFCLIGFSLTAALVVLVGFLTNRRVLLQEEVAERTLELTKSKARFDQIATVSREVFWEVDAKGIYTYVSHMAREVYGYSTDELCGKKYFYDLHPEDGRELFKRQALDLFARGAVIRDLKNSIQKKDGTVIWVSTSGVPLTGLSGEFLGYRGSDNDITERKHVEDYNELEREILQIFNTQESLRDQIQRVLAEVKTRVGVDAVGLRLKEGDDFPYFGQDGFPRDFLLTENTLMERGADGGVCRDKDGNVKLECTCGMVISGKTDPANPLFTPYGSCWTNDSLPLLVLPSDQDPRLNPRNQCIHQGYASIALVPVHAKGQIIGLLQLNARRKGVFSLTAIQQLERLALSFGEAIQRRIAEEALKAKTEFLDTLQSAIPVPIFYKDVDGRYLGVNGAFEEFFGKTAEHFIGKTVFDIASGELAAVYHSKDVELFANPGRQVYEAQAKDARGDLRDVIYYKDSFSVGEKVAGLIGVILDVTEIKRAEAALTKAKEDAEAASRAKSDFLANMSHEIRTPMNAILGFGHLLRNTDINEKQTRFVHTIVSSAQLLMGLINDILDLSKAASGKMLLETTPFDLGQILKDSMHIIEPQVQAPAVRLIANIDAVLGRQYLGDPVRLRQVMINLLGNASKFTSMGEVVLTVRREETDGKRERISFSVKDTGIGIAEDKLKAIFDPFIQADMSTTRKYGGTGLGLSIAKSVVENMGGKLEVSSVLGKGSEFSFSIWFPLVDAVAEVIPGQEPVLTQEPCAGVRVLIAEDNMANQALMREFMAILGCEADYVVNGQAALDLLSKNHGKYDMCFMDIQMPVMGGLEAVKIIRDIIKDDFPIIALTAAAMSGDKDRFLQSGMTDYLSKPILFESLRDKVLKYKKV